MVGFGIVWFEPDDTFRLIKLLIKSRNVSSAICWMFFSSDPNRHDLRLHWNFVYYLAVYGFLFGYFVVDPAFPGQD